MGLRGSIKTLGSHSIARQPLKVTEKMGRLWKNGPQEKWHMNGRPHTIPTESFQVNGSRAMAPTLVDHS